MIFERNKKGSAKASLRWSLFHGKRGGADLLIELVLSAIVFFVIVFFLFGINIPKQQLNACARVVSADATLACETSLNNLLRADSPDGTNYADWLMNSWIKGDTKNWEDNISDVFYKSLGAGDWELDVYLPNSTSIFSTPLGKITTPQLGCFYTIPFPIVLLDKYCGYFEFNTLTTSPVTFSTPDGDARFTIYDDKIWLGADVNCGTNCELNVEPQNDFEERLPNKIPNNAAVKDTITLPVKISGAIYELTIVEISPLDTFNVNVTLARSSALQDCGLTVMLTTLNITDSVQTCNNKPITKII